ncbi:MAG: LysM peptidoglycan-binding domain-containing protein [Anaerolineales bacterium]|nr:LysM peptidoglycan-binding domain-containing protein [Anaerolineales bacterium]
MKHLLGNVKVLLFIALSIVLLAACERPVPGAEPVDATATPAGVLPTTAPTDGGLVQPTAVPADSTSPTPDPAYPAPGEGESSGDTGDEASGGEASGGDTGGDTGGEASGGDTGGESSGGTTANPATHTVQAGDTLYSIALKYGLTVQELATANNITNLDSLSVGDVLTIPAPGSVTDSQQGGGQPATGEQIHIVAPGENLFRIGLRYGFTVAELASYNNIANPNSIAVGQEIRIPAR